MKRNLLWIAVLGFALAGCHTDMWTQAKVTDYDEDETGVFKDGAASRPLVPGTVPRGWARQDVAKDTGYIGSKYAPTLPASLTLDGEVLSTQTDMMKVLKRGQERYNIYCSHCHGAIGDGKGMINQRGLVLRKPIPSYHTDRLRKMPAGYFFDVITNGYGMMLSQASRVKPDDRWAIIAYIQALQLSQNTDMTSLTPADLERMSAPKDDHAGDAAHGGGH